MCVDNDSLSKKIWRGVVSAIGVVGAICILLGASEVPEWIQRWKKIFEGIASMDAIAIRSSLYVLCLLVVVVTNLPWVLHLVKRRRRVDTTGKQESPIQNAGSGWRVVEKSRGVNEARAMIQELIDATPAGTLNRQKVVKWRTRCLHTLRELFADDEPWVKVLAALVGAEDSQRRSASQVKSGIKEVVIQLRAIHARCRVELLRKGSEVTSGEYDSLFPRDSV